MKKSFSASLSGIFFVICVCLCAAVLSGCCYAPGHERTSFVEKWMAQYDIDGAVGMYAGVFNNPFMIWGKYAPICRSLCWHIK